MQARSVLLPWKVSGECGIRGIGGGNRKKRKAKKKIYGKNGNFQSFLTGVSTASVTDCKMIGYVTEKEA